MGWDGGGSSSVTDSSGDTSYRYLLGGWCGGMTQVGVVEVT